MATSTARPRMEAPTIQKEGKRVESPASSDSQTVVSYIVPNEYDPSGFESHVQYIVFAAFLTILSDSKSNARAKYPHRTAGAVADRRASDCRRERHRKQRYYQQDLAHAGSRRRLDQMLLPAPRRQ